MKGEEILFRKPYSSYHKMDVRYIGYKYMTCTKLSQNRISDDGAEISMIYLYLVDTECS
jgi:hypothetical protein